MVHDGVFQVKVNLALLCTFLGPFTVKKIDCKKATRNANIFVLVTRKFAFAQEKKTFWNNMLYHCIKFYD